MTKTRTVIDELKKKVKGDHIALLDFEKSFWHRVRDLQSEYQAGEKIEEKFADLIKTAMSLQQQYQSSRERLGVIAAASLEDKDILAAIIDASGTRAVLIQNLIEIFFRSDYKMLVQVLEQMNPPIRTKAWGKLEQDQLQDIAGEILPLLTEEVQQELFQGLEDES